MADRLPASAPDWRSALERRWPHVQILGELGKFVQAVWRERWRGGTREVIVTAYTPENLEAKMRRPGWVPPG